VVRGRARVMKATLNGSSAIDPPDSVARGKAHVAEPADEAEERQPGE
jgi:hypothetical protein